MPPALPPPPAVDEAEPWLRRAGFRVVEHRPLAGVTSLLIAEAG